MTTNKIVIDISLNYYQIAVQIGSQEIQWISLDGQPSIQRNLNIVHYQETVQNNSYLVHYSSLCFDDTNQQQNTFIDHFHNWPLQLIIRDVSYPNYPTMLGTLRQKRISLSSIVEAFLIKCLNGVSSFIDFKENCMETQFILLFPDIRNNAVDYFKTCFKKALQMFQSNRNDTKFFNSSFTTISRLYPGIKVLQNSQNSCLIDDSQIIQLDETQKNIIVCKWRLQKFWCVSNLICFHKQRQLESLQYQAH
ncbi:Hypothetical_protein [Hexamita inflata]|uniref:Hypothetical_protein n=1 Tax=Hexamita inflata TaxID=28002 RepID=A0ABP1H023_9EUKA